MKNKPVFIYIALVTFILSMSFFFWSKHFSKRIETNEGKESSATKYEFFISSLKQSGEPSGLNYFSKYSQS